MCCQLQRFYSSAVKYAVCVYLQSVKLQFLRHINELLSKDVRTAEMILFSGQQQDAEGLLMQTGLIFRAIMLNLNLFNWDRYVGPQWQSVARSSVVYCRPSELLKYKKNLLIITTLSVRHSINDKSI